MTRSKKTSSNSAAVIKTINVLTLSLRDPYASLTHGFFTKPKLTRSLRNHYAELTRSLRGTAFLLYLTRSLRDPYAAPHFAYAPFYLTPNSTHRLREPYAHHVFRHKQKMPPLLFKNHRGGFLNAS